MPNTWSPRAGDLPAEADGLFRRGRVFTLRLEPKEEQLLRARMLAEWKRSSYSYSVYDTGRKRDSLGAFIVRHALKSSSSIETEADRVAKAKAEPSSRVKRMLAKAEKRPRR